jgi:septum site-determining protein MinC
MTTKIEVKGIKEGLLVTLPAGDWSQVEGALHNYFREKSDFFRDSKIALQIGTHTLTASDMARLRDYFAGQNLKLWAILAESANTAQVARSFGLETALPKAAPPPLSKLDTEDLASPALFVRRTMRSGARVESGGHLVVLGDVNKGAEVVAVGDVIVWGRLLGIAQAGSQGDLSAVVCALDLSPTQLRIASLITTAPQREGEPEPEVAQVIHGRIVAKRWFGKSESHPQKKWWQLR